MKISTKMSLLDFAPMAKAALACNSSFVEAAMSCALFISSSSTSRSRSVSKLLMPWETSRQELNTMPFITAPSPEPRIVAYFVRWSSCFCIRASTCFSSFATASRCVASLFHMLYQPLKVDESMPFCSPRRKRCIESWTDFCLRLLSFTVSFSRRQSTKMVPRVPFESPPIHFLSIISDCACAFPLSAASRLCEPCTACSCSKISCFSRSSQCLRSEAILSSSPRPLRCSCEHAFHSTKVSCIVARAAPSKDLSRAMWTAFLFRAERLMSMTVLFQSLSTVSINPFLSPISHLAMTTFRVSCACSFRRWTSFCIFSSSDSCALEWSASICSSRCCSEATATSAFLSSAATCEWCFQFVQQLCNRPRFSPSIHFSIWRCTACVRRSFCAVFLLKPLQTSHTSFKHPLLSPSSHFFSVIATASCAASIFCLSTSLVAASSRSLSARSLVKSSSNRLFSALIAFEWKTSWLQAP
mmetsp:Transcript_98096/g.281924  ORF Transcript_98096/g.281924 Transcript_98096/m.281924 type:complete len:471 (-) Transcript_98096:2319-3731(-)